MKNKDLKKRVIEISYKNNLSHLGSCLTALPIIDEIYQQKKPDERFVLSSGHAHLAHAVVMEKYGITQDAEENIKKYGIHCEREGGCDVSTGSLGHGLGIALGMALADRSKNVYCLISDGECSEGSVWEALRIQKEQHLDNLLVYVNINGFGAYKDINAMKLANQLEYMSWAVPKFTTNEFSFLNGLDAHYMTMTEENYLEAMKLLK